MDLAKSEERLGDLRARMRQVQESREERRRAIAEGSEELARCDQRDGRIAAEHPQCGRGRRRMVSPQRGPRGADRRVGDRAGDGHRPARRAWRPRRSRIRGRVRKLEEKIHAADLAGGEIKHELSALAGRIREDYGVELSELEHEATGEEQDRRDEVQQEIDALRQKINSLGNVNLEALEELNQLEERHGTLSAQFKNLTDAKHPGPDHREDQRRQPPPVHRDPGNGPRALRRALQNLFGGGQADIVLEEGVDILESGIEIVARPPGKETRSISLLSGGEKTLTCVALLLAMFRSRPSPFCVLDEVDAALDEANIDRFTKVLTEFLTWTQFIIVTHSRRR